LRPALQGLLETALYVEDPHRSAEFYSRLFGLTAILESSRLIAMAMPDQRVLLLFRKGGTGDTDGSGRLHNAFAVRAEDLPRWEEWLAANGIAVESRKKWDLGGESIYFRDPDEHLLELATPGVWSVY
jgi:catechol 2,3-dioxygenase-like lactoylglutathione lyase family enzyme